MTILQSTKIKPLFILAIVTMALTFFVMGKYIEFNSPGAFDSGSYIYSAQKILNGAKVGIDEKPSAKTGTLLINMLGVKLFGFNEVGPKIIQMILQAMSLTIMFYTLKKLFDPVSAAIAVFMAAYYLSAPLIAKSGNVKEQYMIAFMLMGVNLFLLYKTHNTPLKGALAGLCLVLAPLFKPTAISAISAVAFFLIFELISRKATLKTTMKDLGLLLIGASTCLIPIYIWLWLANTPINYWPYYSIIKSLAGLFTNNNSSYIADSHQLTTFAQQFKIVTNYYCLLLTPISMAITALLIRTRRSLTKQNNPHDRFIWLLGIWWIGDMALIWVSPRSYQQYYLPLIASAAMLSSYTVYSLKQKLNFSPVKPKWLAITTLSLILLIACSAHIFFGITKSPHTNKKYNATTRGYLPQIKQIHLAKKNNYSPAWIHQHCL